MPYANKEARHDMANGKPAITASELNYAITLEVIDLLKQGLNGNPDKFEARVRGLIDQYWSAPYRVQNYQTANDVSGALVNAALEFARRQKGKLPRPLIDAVIGMLAEVHIKWYDDVVAPYEDGKIIENGDVYPPSVFPEAEAMASLENVLSVPGGQA